MAENELFELVLPDLKRLARYFMKRERPGHLLQPTALVNTIYFRLVAAKDRDWRNRSHFFAIAARAMRRHLIDIARGEPDVQFVPVSGMADMLHADSSKLDLVITIDRLLNELAAIQPDWCIVAEMKCFLGLTDEEAAEALGIPSLRTTQRMWLEARKWLFERTQSASAATTLSTRR